jgi:energy-coupling factor transporter ATP-binding protein EcfA2
MNPEEQITYFAETDSRNRKTPFGIKAKDRTKHMYVIGKTGMGKSTLLENMAVQDIKNGNGFAFMDPHGQTAELLLKYIPEERKKDVLYFAPFDMEHPVSFNVMEDVGPEKRHLVTSGLMSAFKKIWVDAWSARMEYILNNVILALLEYPDSTLIGVNRMLSDKGYRDAVVKNVKDPAVKAFWVDEFAKYGDKYMQEAGAAIQNKIGQFISNPVIRNLIGQPKSSFDIRKFIDEKKIIIINLSKGRIGEANANLLGSMLVTKIYLAAMSRADVSDTVLKTLPNFYLFVDEFQSFANESFANILSEARKYKLNLTIAHQYIEQMPEEVRAAVFGNVGTMITFRVGAFDAEVLQKEFSPEFTAEDLVNLGFTQIYLKLMIDGVSSKPFSATTLPPIKPLEISLKEDVVDMSRKQFSNSREVVEASISEWHEKEFVAQSQGGQQRKPQAGGQRGQQQQGYTREQNRAQDDRGQQRPPRQESRPTTQMAPVAEVPAKPVPPPVVPAPVVPVPIKQAVSLSTLPKITPSPEIKKSKEEEERLQRKVLTPENAASLKEALLNIMPQATPQIEKVDTTTKTSTDQIFKEIPEQELKKMLEADES